ncbi:pyruvate, water dikinase regulatory protein [Aquibaculum sediminis]|uniref:pyruvate, water dikinase regulatory protein n=1 Tax=Aquibaculum sediminis TaxID=3231907 RepID=UPI003453AE9F
MNEGNDTVHQHHLHLISDATGETVNSVARACLVQFDAIEPIEHIWTLVRTRGQLDKAIAAIEANPGPVLYTMVDDSLRGTLIDACHRLNVAAVDILDPVMHALAGHFRLAGSRRPGRQHTLDSVYFDRIEAMDFAIAHDDGQGVDRLEHADVVLVGVSRTSKTPTCIYLAQRGVRAANVPIVPNLPLPQALFRTRAPLIVGLTKDPARLVDVRRTRLRAMGERNEAGSYADLETVAAEVQQARRLCAQRGWPVIDVTRRSIEETAAAILTLLQEHRKAAAQ